MKLVGILAIIGGLLIIVMNLPGMGGRSGVSPQVIAGAVVGVIGVLLVWRPGSRKR
jgi:hypothetical protein